jgi:hypothetical protein
VCVECEQELPSIMFSGHQKDVFDQNLRTCEVCASANASQRKDTLPCHICSHPTDVRFLLAKMRQNLSGGYTTLLCPDCRRGGFTKKNETKKNCVKCLQKRPTCAYLERSDRCNFCDASYLSCARCGDPLALASLDKNQRQYMRRLHRENKPIIFMFLL